MKCVRAGMLMSNQQWLETFMSVSAQSGRGTKTCVMCPEWPRYQDMCDTPKVAKTGIRDMLMSVQQWLETSMSVNAQSG